MFQTVKLAKLRLSPINVRTAEDKALAIEPLAADITARGVLQNLLITPINKPRGMFEVFDGDGACARCSSWPSAAPSSPKITTFLSWS